MPASRFARKRALFEQALRLPAAMRRNFLELECAGDSQLREDVERLLAADRAEAPELDLTFSELAEFLNHEDEPPSPPFNTLGGYRLIRSLGSGGMGEVFLAERLDNGHLVAIKILKPESVHAPEIARRFELEKDLLSRLRHPNIARFYDSGIAGERPWFAMDFIEGSPIVAYCERENLTLRPRLALMQKLCEAVAYAHDESIVHCDLTPNNILVSDDGEPHLVDFGIARILSQIPGIPSVSTSATRPYSVSYASPEQIQYRPLDPQTDAWSLGAILYALLTGQPPFTAEGILSGRAIEDKILHADPVPPSVACARVRRSVFASPSDWKKLDALCLWALRKDPGSRCRAGQLRDDIGRFLASEPLAASRAGGRYRARQFAGGKVAAIAALVTLAIIAGTLAVRHVAASAPPQLKWSPITKAIHPANGIASDGRSVFWTECDTSGCRPWQAPLDRGKEASSLSTPFPYAFVMDAAPANRLLLAVPDTPGVVGLRGLQGALWELDIALGRTRRIGYLTGEDAAWSPDLARLAFVQRNEIWLAGGDGSAPRRLAALPGAIADIHWSPDGKLLRFTLHSSTGNRGPLWEVEAESGRSRPLALESGDVSEWSDVSEETGAWTSSGAFVFGTERPSESDLWQLVPRTWPSSGHRLEQLTRGPIEFSGPVNIPGRPELAAIGTHEQGELAQFDSRAGDFVPFLNGISADMADFSRDGKWVAYVTYPGGILWRSRADGSDSLQLTPTPLRAGLPRIAPDDSRIAFTAYYSGKDYAGKQMRTWLVPLNGGEPKPATKLAPGAAEVAPTWSPDSTKLLLRLGRGGDSNVLQILDLRSGHMETVPNSNGKLNPRWSPDGRWLAATPDGQDGLEVFSLKTRQWTTLTNRRADYPNWSRNSDFIYFRTRFEGGEEAICRVSVASGKTEQVTALAGAVSLNDGTYGEWMGIAPDDSPLILRNASLRRIYLLSITGR